jgi:tRNA uridine 5-carbamoylmethylation protein Kti12
VRAKLVDKDNKPRWNPARLEQVTEELIDQIFAPFEDPAQELDFPTRPPRFPSPL